MQINYYGVAYLAMTLGCAVAVFLSPGVLPYALVGLHIALGFLILAIKTDGES